ncbi:MAG: glycosyltransferase family 4 protein [Planctomycetota bacterium]
MQLEPSSAASSSVGANAPPVVVVPSSLAPETPSRGSIETSTLRVLHVVNGESFAGAERVQSHLGRCLPSMQVDADFVCVKPGKFAERLASEAGQWGKCFQAKMLSRFDLRASWSIRKLVRRGHYQLMHAHTPRTAMLASVASRMTGIPWVYHVHSPASRDSDNPLANRVNSIVERFSLRNCRQLLTVSESLRLEYARLGFSEQAITVVHNGVPAMDPKTAIRRTAVPKVGGAWVLGMVALMRPRKGLEIALEALAKVRERFDVKLRIIGPFESDAYESFIEDRIAELRIAGGIERVGFTNNVTGELSKLDALVLPSLFGEGLPMVVLEAMASGLPVIATRVEGTPEAVTDGVEGLLAEPRDPESLAGRICELVSGKFDWRTMSELARQRHAADFSDAAMAKKVAAVYRRILGVESR